MASPFLTPGCPLQMAAVKGTVIHLPGLANCLKSSNKKANKLKMRISFWRRIARFTDFIRKAVIKHLRPDYKRTLQVTGSLPAIYSNQE
jgi:hypothetical protein